MRIDRRSTLKQTQKSNTAPNPNTWGRPSSEDYFKAPTFPSDLSFFPFGSTVEREFLKEQYTFDLEKGWLFYKNYLVGFKEGDDRKQYFYPAYWPPVYQFGLPKFEHITYKFDQIQSDEEVELPAEDYDSPHAGADSPPELIANAAVVRITNFKRTKPKDFDDWLTN